MNEQEILDSVRGIFVEQIPFNRVLVLSIEELSAERARIRFEMRDDLVGNFVHGSLHGGVISAVLDVTGGLMAFTSLLLETGDSQMDDARARLARTGTVDLRVDYLRPGKGSHFYSTGFVLRKGSRLAVIRMELHNDRSELIAVGTGAYSIG